LDPSDYKCKRIDKKDIWDIADEVRHTYWQESTLPIDVEKIVAFRLKLRIEPIHGLFSATDMDAYLMMDSTAIAVDYDSYMNERFASRLRFSFAHELGHFFLHKEVFAAFDIRTLVDWKNFILNSPDYEYSSFEWQANEFAGRLLVPHSDLVRAIEQAANTIKENNLVDYLGNDPDAVLSRISPTICKPFGVSADVIKRRVEREGLWPPELL
jgi:Zn-dependent peptidase ImmA (M78 family)